LDFGSLGVGKILLAMTLLLLYYKQKE